MKTQDPKFATTEPLSTALREHRAFLAHARHELRTPLNAIIGYSEILLEEAEDEGRTELLADLERIQQAGKELLAIISDILDPARYDEQEELDLDPLSDHVRQAMQEPLTTVVTLSDMLLRDIGEDGAFAAELQKIHGAGIKLVGMSADIRRFAETVAGSTKSEGTQPEATDLIIDAVSTIPPISDAPRPAGTETGRILIADDHETNRDLIRRRIEREGYVVEVAENGRQAILRLESQPFDLLLLDVMMPEMNGYQVLQYLKSHETLRHIPVIMISALDEMDSVVRCIEMGAEDYLPKTFDPVLLRARVGACLEKKRLRDSEVALHAELEENYKRLKELEALRDSLTHMVVHDLRTPLTSLIGGLQTIGTLGELNEDQDEFLEIAVNGGKTLLGMINDLLDISKMEDGSLKLDMTQVDPASLAARAIVQVAGLASEKKLSLTSQVDPATAHIAADDEKLLRILVNLLGNAIKFTPSRGSIGLTVGPAESESAVLFAISDTGEGIPKEAFSRIFEKFGQVENRKSGRRMSTGLGLTFCKMAVEAHSGRIWVESELGEGSTFLFTIPAK